MKKAPDFPEYSSIIKGKTCPGGFTTADKKQAAKIFLKLKQKHPTFDDTELWLTAVNVVIDSQRLNS